MFRAHNLESFFIAIGRALLIVLLFPGAADAATLTVDDSGGADYTSIQAAINAANNGDIIQVAAGTYAENIVVNKSVTMQGESNSTTVIWGNGSGDVVLVTSSGVTIDKFKVQNGSTGINVTSGNNVISNNVIMDMIGVRGNDDISDNQSGGSGGVSSGIYLSGSTNNTLTGNTISNMTGGTGGTGGFQGTGGSGGVSSGIYLSGSTNNTLTGNTISNMTGGTGGAEGDYGSGGSGQVGYGIYLESNSYENMIGPTNTMDNDPIVYLYNANGEVIENYVLIANSNPTNLGKIVIINSINNTIRNNTISNMTGGTGGTGGWRGSGGSGNVSSGIYLSGSTNNTLASNTISNMTGGTGGTGGWRGSGGSGGVSSGIYLSVSTNNTLTGNTVSNMTGGTGGTGGFIGSGGSGGISSGIYFSVSTNNTLTGNTINNITGRTGGTGGYGGSVGSDGIGYSAYLNTSTFNQLFHNNLLDNGTFAYDNSSNSWDNGTSGNYWGNYTGLDNNSDGIGDTPYNISGGSSQDRYPLMQQWNVSSSDTTPPASISNLSNASYARNYINWTWTDPSDSDFSNVTIYLNGTFQANVTNGSQSYNATGLTEDTVYIIGTRTVDTTGNVNSTWVNHSSRTSPVPDTTLPNLTITSPASGATLTSSNITVSGTASDNVGLSKVEVKVGSGNWTLANGTTSWNRSVTLAYGSNTIYANATDTSGNTNITSISVTLINFTNVSIADSQASVGDNVTVPIYIDVEDSSGLATATINLTFNASVVNVSTVNSSDFDALVPNINNTQGFVRMVAYQTGITGAGPGRVRLANVTLRAVGIRNQTSPLNLSVSTLKNNSGIDLPYQVSNGTFEVLLDGDFSGDGVVDSWDVTYLARYLVGIPGYENAGSRDISGDGVIDAWDCTYLARAIAGIPGYYI